MAILIVVAFHCGTPGFQGGFVGVDVFFVLSGYLITGLLVAEIRKTSRVSLRQFYARRARRLLPASALVLSVSLVAGGVILAPQELTFASRAARATALYLGNFFFARNAADYFGMDVRTNPLLHTWSLAVEEQFYLFWPLLILICFRLRNSMRLLFAVLSGLTIVSIATCVWVTPASGTFAFYGLPTRAWEFGIGGLGVLKQRGSTRLPGAVWLAVGWLGILTVLGAAYFVRGGSEFPGWIALVPAFGAMATLIAGAELPHRGIGVLLESSPAQLLGALSYSWYLWHWPFLVLSAALLPNLSLVGKIVAAGASLAIAAVTHHFVENPIRFHPYLINRPALSLFLAAGIALFSLTVAFLYLQLAVQLANAPAMKSITAAVEDIADMPRQQCVSLGDSPEVKTCVFGNASSSTNILLFGDSHAVQWFNPLRQIVLSHAWRLTTFVKSGCPATDIVPLGTSSIFAANCKAWRIDAIRKIIALRPSVVFLGNSTTYLQHPGENASGFDTSLREWRIGTKRTLEALTAPGFKVVAMRDTPLSTFDVPTCLARSLRHPWYRADACEIDISESMNATIFEAEIESAQGLPNVNFLDVTDRLCQGKVCSAVKKDMIVYRDNNHITGRFAESLSPILEAKLVSLLSNSN